MEKMKLKLLLEKIYEEFCKSEVDAMRENVKIGMMDNVDDVELLDKFIKFRLRVSGGSECSCSVSMDNVDNFIVELKLWDDMLSDVNGCYRGEFSWECLEGLEELIDEMGVDEELKNEIVVKYKTYFNMDEGYDEDDDE